MPQLVDRLVDELLAERLAAERRTPVVSTVFHTSGVTWAEVERRLIALRHLGLERIR